MLTGIIESNSSTCASRHRLVLFRCHTKQGLERIQTARRVIPTRPGDCALPRLLYVAEGWHIVAVITKRENFGKCERPTECHHRSVLRRGVQQMRIHRQIFQCCRSVRDLRLRTTSKGFAVVRHGSHYGLKLFYQE